MSTAIVDKNRRFHTLEEVFADDDLNLIGEVEVREPGLVLEDKLKEKDRELLDYVKKFQRLPAENGDLPEKRLYRRLQAMQKSEPELAAALRQMAGGGSESEGSATPAAAEKVEPSAATEKIYQSLDDILNEDDDLGLLGDTSVLQSLIATPSDRPVSRPKAADFIARATPCRDFFRYKPIFDEVRAALASHDLIMQRRRGYYVDTLEEGQIFVLKGIFVLLCYCDREHIEIKNHRRNFRIDLVYSTGNENNPIAYTFLKSLTSDTEGMIINAATARGEELLAGIKKQLQELREAKEQAATAQQTVSGYIYILHTKSQNPAIQEFLQHSHLVKIGYCTTPVEERIKNAAQEATYLYAPVEVVKTYRCYGNIDAHKFEHLVHAVLYRHRFQPVVTDAKGRRHQPREWFTVSAETACEVVDRIIDHTIMNYRINPVDGRLVKVS